MCPPSPGPLTRLPKKESPYRKQPELCFRRLAQHGELQENMDIIHILGLPNGKCRTLFTGNTTKF